jgi:hypothetical protein
MIVTDQIGEVVQTVRGELATRLLCRFLFLNRSVAAGFGDRVGIGGETRPGLPASQSSNFFRGRKFDERETVR